MGFLISVEGGDFTGKSSLVVPSLKVVLESVGFNIKTSREPGGTPQGEKIREQIFTRLREGASQQELAFLFNQARQIHLQEVIIPFLGSNKEKDGILILDRYLDSTRVYQGLEGGVSLEILAQYEQEFANGFYPDLTLILFFPESRFRQTFEMRRRFSQKEEGRSQTGWDEQAGEKHLLRQRNFLRLPRTYEQMKIPRKFVMIDASGHPFEVVRGSVSAVASLLNEGRKDLEKEMLAKFEELRLQGEWDCFDEIWQEQHRLYAFSLEGSGLVGKER